MTISSFYNANIFRVTLNSLLFSVEKKENFHKNPTSALSTLSMPGKVQAKNVVFVKNSF